MKRTSTESRQLLRARFTLPFFMLLLASALIPVTAEATHFRYAHYTWTQLGGNTIEATLQNAWRRDGYGCVDPATLGFIPCSPGDGFPQVGDVIAEFIGFTTFNWGDGTPPVGSPLGPLLFQVTAIDPVNNWWFGEALDPASLPAIDRTLSHTYAAPGDYTAFTDSCCRISGFEPPNEHINNPDGGYRVETIINVGTTNNSPVSVLQPIILCPIDALCEFLVPVADNDPLSIRLSTSAEASGFGFTQPGPPQAPNAASIDPVTHLYTWDTTGAILAADPANNTLYSTQVTIEDPTSKIALDFLIQLDTEDPNPPIIESPVGSPPVCETTQVVSVGGTKTFDVIASDPDPSDDVTLNVVGLPMGAAMTPTLPEGGNPVSSTFAWTPAPEQVGLHVINFSAESTGGAPSALCPVTLSAVVETCLGEPPTDGCTVNDIPDQPCVGTPERDVIFGTDGPDVISGLDGNDIIKGRGGDDLICGDAGRDNLHGNNGDDELDGGDGHDNLQGNKGFDTCLNGENIKKGCEVLM